MPYNLLLLPLLGGYLFAFIWHRTRFYVIRAEKEKLLIISSICGLGSIILAYSLHLLCCYFFPCSSYNFCLSEMWRKNIPFEYSDISLLSFFLGIFTALFLNRFKDKDINKVIDEVIQKDGEPFELLLRRAQKDDIVVSITMKNGKVYLGKIKHQFDPGSITKFISIMPVGSGYRDNDTKSFISTINYKNTLDIIKREALALQKVAKALQDGDEKARYNLVIKYRKLSKASDLFLLVLPVSEIVSASFYDTEIQGKYFGLKPVLYSEPTSNQEALWLAKIYLDPSSSDYVKREVAIKYLKSIPPFALQYVEAQELLLLENSRLIKERSKFIKHFLEN